jgi:hypothetical protein
MQQRHVHQEQQLLQAQVHCNAAQTYAAGLEQRLAAAQAPRVGSAASNTRANGFSRVIASQGLAQ